MANPENVMMFDLTASVSVERDPDGTAYVSYCRALDVGSVGDTREEAIEMLGDAIRAFIESCYNRGTLFQVLGDCGMEMNVREGRVSEPELHTFGVSIPV